MINKNFIAVLCIGFSFNAMADNKYHALLDDIGRQLKERYVFPKVGQKYADRLEQCKQSNCLKEAKNENEVAKRVSELLNSVHQDKHLIVSPPGFESPIPKMKMVEKGGKKVAKVHTGISEQRIIENNIGYLKYDMFPGFPEAFEATKQAMIDMKDTNALIFDIRDHRGGHPYHVEQIASFLFEQPTHMLTTRSPNKHDGKPWKLISELNQYAKFYRGKPIYLLTSERSGSAAEHFSMAMKSTGRAIIVGETTGGYGHWGDQVELIDGFSMFLPQGGSFHPTNGLGWEQIGVTPDIQMDDEASFEFTVNRINTFM